jgi:hypothetical protein
MVGASPLDRASSFYRLFCDSALHIIIFNSLFFFIYRSKAGLSPDQWVSALVVAPFFQVFFDGARWPEGLFFL